MILLEFVSRNQVDVIQAGTSSIMTENYLYSHVLSQYTCIIFYTNSLFD